MKLLVLIAAASAFAMNFSDFRRSDGVEDRRLPWQKDDSLFDTQIQLLTKLTYDADEGFVNGFYRYRNFALSKCAKGRKHAEWARATGLLMDSIASTDGDDGFNLKQAIDTKQADTNPSGIDGFGDHDGDADALLASVNDCTSEAAAARRYVNSQLAQNELANSYLHNVFGESAGKSADVLAGLRSALADCPAKDGPGAAGADHLEQSLGRFQFAYGEADQNLTHRAKALTDTYSKLVDLGGGPAKCTFMPWRRGKFVQ